MFVNNFTKNYCVFAGATYSYLLLARYVLTDHKQQGQEKGVRSQNATGEGVHKNETLAKFGPQCPIG